VKAMSTREIRRRCQDLVRDLDVPDPFAIDRFCAGLAAKRGRPIELCPLPMPPDSPCGVWVSTARRDFIFYEEDTSLLHQEHIIMHEVGHLLTDHGGAPADDEVDVDHGSGDTATATAARILLPHLDPTLVDRVLNRTAYTAVDERMAETVASMILERANRWRPTPQWTAPAHGAEIRNRLGATFDPAVGRRRP
jgi:hypothetical protein